MLTEDRLRTVFAAIIIAFSWSLAFSALAEESASATPVWLWSDTTLPHSDSAATAFSQGDYTAGLRLSHRALAKADSKRGRLIAHHNLCIAQAQKSRMKTALRHCQETRRLADSGFIIASGKTSETASDILDSNLANIGMTGLGTLP